MDEKIEKGSGNIFEDLGLKDSWQTLAKADLLYQITKIIEKRKLKQKEIADLLKIDQPKVSALMNGKIYGFSLERLFGFLFKLDRSITILIQKQDHSGQPTPHVAVEGNG